jgi:hypothetical protein
MIGNLTTSSSPPIVPEAKIEKVLGVIAERVYILHRGVEYAVDMSASEPGTFAYIEGEIRISRKRFADDNGRRLEIGSAMHRGVPVVSGSHAAQLAKQAEQTARREVKPKPRPLDALATHPFLARRADGILPIADAALVRSDNLLDAALARAPDKESAALLSAQGLAHRAASPTAIMLPGREPRQGVAAILDVLQERGITLHLSPAGTMYALGTRITTPARSLIEQAAPLLHAHLRGQPLRCEFGHPEQAPEAVTLLVGGAAACEQHLSGEIEP